MPIYIIPYVYIWMCIWMYIYGNGTFVRSGSMQIIRDRFGPIGMIDDGRLDLVSDRVTILSYVRGKRRKRRRKKRKREREDEELEEDEERN